MSTVKAAPLPDTGVDPKFLRAHEITQIAIQSGLWPINRGPRPLRYRPRALLVVSRSDVWPREAVISAPPCSPPPYRPKRLHTAVPAGYAWPR